MILVLAGIAIEIKVYTEQNDLENLRRTLRKMHVLLSSLDDGFPDRILGHLYDLQLQSTRAATGWIQ